MCPNLIDLKHDTYPRRAMTAAFKSCPLGPPYTENSRAKNSSFFAKSRASFTLHGTKTRVLSKNSSFQVAKVDNLTNSKCQVVDFCDQKNSSFEIPKMPQRVLASRHNMRLLLGSCGHNARVISPGHTFTR